MVILRMRINEHDPAANPASVVTHSTVPSSRLWSVPRELARKQPRKKGDGSGHCAYPQGGLENPAENLVTQFNDPFNYPLR